MGLALLTLAQRLELLTLAQRLELLTLAQRPDLLPLAKRAHPKNSLLPNLTTPRQHSKERDLKRTDME